MRRYDLVSSDFVSNQATLSANGRAVAALDVDPSWDAFVSFSPTNDPVKRIPLRTGMLIVPADSFEECYVTVGALATGNPLTLAVVDDVAFDAGEGRPYTRYVDAGFGETVFVGAGDTYQFAGTIPAALRGWMLRIYVRSDDGGVTDVSVVVGLTTPDSVTLRSSTDAASPSAFWYIEMRAALPNFHVFVNNNDGDGHGFYVVYTLTPD